jgi:hypothetical protein
MKYLVIEAPPLTDEAAINLQDFFYALMDAFGEHYHYQIERYYRESVIGSMPDVNVRLTEDEPPF